MSEYNNSAVKGGACSYTNLCSYNNGAQGMASAPSMATVGQKLIVPTFGGPAGYSCVSGRNVPTCTGFATLTTAYGDSSNCNGGCSSQYVAKLCQ